MPQTKSAKKRLRQNVKRRAHNRAGRSRLRTALKGFDAAVAGGTGAEALPAAMAAVDRAAAKGLIHKREAARRKARMSKRVTGTKTGK